MAKKRKVANTKSLRDALAAHNKFLRKMGIDPDRKPRRLVVAPDPLNATRHVIKQELLPTSDKVGNGFQRKGGGVSNLPVAQVYHKGPLMVVTDMKSLDGSKRRG